MHLDPYVEAGLPAGFTLKMISVNGAQLLGIADERGRIAPGFAADIIATSGNPLEDISVIPKPHPGRANPGRNPGVTSKLPAL